jgi:hypothetical protein
VARRVFLDHFFVFFGQADADNGIRLGFNLERD